MVEKREREGRMVNRGEESSGGTERREQGKSNAGEKRVKSGERRYMEII